MAYIPNSIIFDILIRLPVKSLLRFKTLNKPCCSIITDQYFISTHFNHNTTNEASNNSLIITCMEHRNPTTTIHFFTLCLGVDEHHAANAIVEYSATVSFDTYRVLPSCNGLVCFYGLHGGGGVHVCNPSTKHIVKLPDSDDDARDFRLLSCGFGFDETSGTYKVIKFLEPRSIEIFTTMGNNNNGSWRKKIRYFYPLCFTYLHHQPPVFSRGFFYWFSTSSSSIIVSFDIGNEIFEPISTPETVSGKDLCKLYLVELRGELCLVDLDYGRMDIWVLKKKHWEQLGTIIHESERIDTVRPVGYVKRNDEILLHGFIKGMVGHLSCYNLEAGGFRALQIEGIPSQWYHVSQHVETLFQVGHS